MRQTTPPYSARTATSRARRGRDVLVRAALRGDLRAVAVLWAEAERLHSIWHPEYFRGEGRLDERLLRLIEYSDGRGELMVVEQKSTVVGFVHVEMLVPKRGGVASGRRAHIDTLVVAPYARRVGCGKRLVTEAACWARAHGAAELLLTVWAGNEDAEKFYAKLGLQPVSRVMKLTL